jgi:hypothetical protein
MLPIYCMLVELDYCLNALRSACDESFHIICTCTRKIRRGMMNWWWAR